MTASVQLDRHGPVAVLRLNRPEVLNAINGEVCTALCHYVDELEADGTTRVMVISGAGDRAFSAGADLTHMRTLSDGDLSQFIELTWHSFERISQSSIPSVAALHGHVLGGGLELAVACDFRIAHRTTSIALPEMGLGSVPGSGAMQRLPGLIGESKTLELAIFGTRVSAQEALMLGLVNKVVEDDRDAERAAIEWAQVISSRPAAALKYAKVAIRARGDPVLAASLHGLISVSCHQSKSYQQKTDKFRS